MPAGLLGAIQPARVAGRLCPARRRWYVDSTLVIGAISGW